MRIFKKVTSHDRLEEILRGIKILQGLNFKNIKINAVPKPSKKDSELENMVIDGFLCEKHYQQIIKSTLKKTNKKVKLESIIIN